MDASFVLHWAAAKAGRYDRNAQGEVRLNVTDSFHLCGLIERAASTPRSGSTHRRSMGREVVAAAKAQFCRTHQVAHPSVWEWETKRTPDEVRQALLISAQG